MSLNHEKITSAVNEILLSLNEDPNRPGLKETPSRVAKSLSELTSGMGYSAADVVGDGIFNATSQGMVLERDIEFFSLCEHHLLPFFGKVHFAYVPNKKIIGLSKIGRLIDIFAKRLQVQENLTSQIAKAFMETLQPKGVAIMVTASHFCMMMRGVKKQHAVTVTTEFCGIFKDDNALRNDFFTIVKK